MARGSGHLPPVPGQSEESGPVLGRLYPSEFRCNMHQHTSTTLPSSATPWPHPHRVGCRFFDMCLKNHHGCHTRTHTHTQKKKLLKLREGGPGASLHELEMEDLQLPNPSAPSSALTHQVSGVGRLRDGSEPAFLWRAI